MTLRKREVTIEGGGSRSYSVDNCLAEALDLLHDRLQNEE
jgi:hypothetical protein